MLTVRIIPCLDVEDGRVVKGIRFTDLQEAGDPVDLAADYNEQGADEIVFLDIGASYRRRKTMVDVVNQVSRRVFVPLTAGGGIRSVEDMRILLQSGADKVAVCSAALKRPGLISEGAEVFGSQCLVLSIDAKQHGGSWRVYSHGGRIDTGLDVLEWARQGEKLGAGEILLNSIDADGTREGFDLELTRKVGEILSIPVIASGGAGSLAQIYAAFSQGKADAALLASLFHFKEYTVRDVKTYLKMKGIRVR
ncbi:MAG: imidazole glycerol phosphate synthase subunit HisF [Candidatus Aminicenantes bacterium]|nr:imidazole glycerol phosphate synthase subunit HisF [Candidatus Aminicenantes bacterium]